MKKNINLKIVILFFLIGVVLILGLGASYIYMLNQLEIIGTEQANVELIQSINAQISQTKLAIIISLAIYSVISILIGFFVAKALVFPMKKLIKSAEKIASGEKIKKGEGTQNNSEVGDLENAFSIMTDELQQKFSEVNRQKKQIETILLHITDGIIAFDIDGKILHINPAAKELLELEETDDSFDKIFNKLDIDINIEKVIYLENWTSSEQRKHLGDKYINILFAPFQDENDRPAGVVALIQDITEHVRLDNMRKEFVADVSHELKTPITSIMGYSDTLLEGEYDEETRTKFLNVISSEAKRMARLVTDLLTLSRYDSKKVTSEITSFDLGELVKKCQEKLRFEIEKKGHNVECFVTASVPPVIADRYGIERVVLNILSNAIKYTPDNGLIKVYVGFVYNDAYIKVIDNGIGIPEEDLERIFDRFYRVDKARSRELGGTGLGLSIAKEILDQNKGSINIKSEVGKGTEVVIRIPTKSKNK
jgi:two-component system sensor histidine kinase VicK